ncbi:MAG TPA: hypothetical protein DEQ26_11475 [Flavobacteriaceae bacterium]|nr:hypothetical protein [Flavobacteriaceae bacterium]
MDDYSLVEIKALCKNYYYLNSISEAKLDLDLALQSVLIDINESEYIKLVYGCGLNISQYLDFACKTYREYKDIDQSVFAKLKALMNDEIRVFSNRKRCNPFDVDADLRARIRGVLVEDNDELMLNYLNITIDDRPLEEYKVKRNFYKTADRSEKNQSNDAFYREYLYYNVASGDNALALAEVCV